MNQEIVIETLKIILPAITAIGVIIAIYTLRANHDWNRRNYAISLLEKWNEKTIVHRRAIENFLPGLLDKT